MNSPMSVRPASGRVRTYLAAARSGTWLTPERLRVYPALLGGALALAIVAIAVSGDGLTDHWHRPLGTDFSGIWVAGREVLLGDPARPYDNARHAAAIAAVFGPSDGFLPWPYPPYFLAVAAVLATMPYLLALGVYQGVTLLLYGRAVMAAGAGLPRRELMIAGLAFPAVAINLLHGHNGFLSAALLAGGGLLLPRRPLLAGCLFGLLVYKPQFALAIPVALVAGRQWRVIGAAAATAIAATLATYLAFGSGPWWAFADSLAFTRHVVLERGGLDSYKLQSAFAAIRLWGGSVGLAYAVQTVVTGLGLAGLAWLWWGAADRRLKLAGLIVASLLSTPYAMDYDMAMLGPALAAMAAFGTERGFPPFGRTILATVWLVPLLARTTAMVASLPIGVLAMAVCFAMIMRETWRTKEDASRDQASLREPDAAVI